MFDKIGTLITALLLVSCADEPPLLPVENLDSGPDMESFCAPPSNIVQDVTCATPDEVCPGSCREGLAGVTGVGSLSCRCMDVGSGFGAQWICDTAACDIDAGILDAGTSDAGTGDAAVDANSSCPPATIDGPTEPTCTASQYLELQEHTTEAEAQAFVDDPANANCTACTDLVVIACASERSCGQSYGNFACCVSDACGTDAECRRMAVQGVCRTEADAFLTCVRAEESCDWEAGSPPEVCFP